MKNTKIYIAVSLLALVIAFGSIKTASAANGSHPAGTLLLSNGTVYKVSDDGSSLESFESAAKFLSHYYNFPDAVPMNSADNALPKTGLALWGDGRIFNDAGTIFQASGTVKYGFPTQDIFQSYGFSFSQAATATVNLTQSQTINSKDQAHLPGTFVNASGTVWEVLANSRLAVSEPGVLYSWGRKFSDVVPANAADIQKPDGGLLKFRIGTLVNDQGTISVIQANGKQSFASADCFTNFGFSFAKIITGSAKNYPNLGSVCGPTPASAYIRKTVTTSRGNFTADVMTFNLSDVKVVTDTANDTDCYNGCATKSLMSYVTGNAGFAAINGTYFCPTDYSDCAGKTNSYYWKVYNSRIGTMLNATNGIKEDVPFFGFKDSEARFFTTYRAYLDSGWGSITAGINHEPGLVANGQIILNESQIDAKELSTKSNRGSLGLKGQTVYAVIAKSATVPDMAAIMQALGVDSAVNLDGGGSSSMIFDGSYKVGPGRNLPNAIVFVRK